MALFYIINQGLANIPQINLKPSEFLRFIGIIDTAYYKHSYDEDNLPLFFQVLNGKSKESTFQALKTGIRLRWEQTYDTIYPYGDNRSIEFETVWTFNLDSDILLFSKNNQNSGQVPLQVLRQRLVTFDDFEPRNPPTPPIFDLEKDFPPPYWEPLLEVQRRNKAFTHRVLNDFNFQYRHILRNRYNDITFRKLAHAVVRLVTLDFSIVEITKSRPAIIGTLVHMIDLPKWEPLDSQIVQVGRVWLVASHDPRTCIPLIREHISTTLGKGSERLATSADETTMYLILSVRHIILCRVDGDRLEWSRPEPFLNGTDVCSDRAAELLLWATYTDPPDLPIHRLPLEIQDKILRYLSQGPVEAARMGCVLGFGSLFRWKDGRMDIGREKSHRGWLPFTPVESQIWFGDHMSGICYRGMEGTLKPPYVITQIAPGVTMRS